MQDLGDIIRRNPDVMNVAYWINLSPLPSATAVMTRIKKAAANIEGLTLALQIRQDIQVGGRSSAAEYQYILQSGDTAELAKWAGVMKDAILKLPGFLDVTSDKQRAATSVTLDIDRPTTAPRLGISVQPIGDALYDALGQRQLATLFTQARGNFESPCIKAALTVG